MKIFATLGVVFALFFTSAATVYAGGGFNSGQSFPYIGTDEDSVEFIVEAIFYSITRDAYDAAMAAYEAAKEKYHEEGGEKPEEPEEPDDLEDNVEDALKANFQGYAEDLAETLSQLSPSEQNAVWYGS